MPFLQKPLALFSNIYLCVQSKNCVRNKFLIFLFRILSAFERKCFQTSGEKPSKSCQNYLLRVQRNNLWLEKIFKSFESFCIFCRNLWHCSQISMYVSTVKIAEGTVFWFFFSEFFFGFWVKIFSDFRPKNFKKLSKLPSACPQEKLVALNFFKSFEPFWIFYRNLWHGSQNSIYVSRVKIALETVFLFFFSEFFSDFERKFFRPPAKNLQKVVKTTFCVSRGTICGLKHFLKFWIVLHFLQKPLAWFSNIYLRVQSENCGRNSFLIFLFRIFSEFERKIFQTFSQKTSKSCQNYLLRVQRNNLWLEIFFKSFEALCIFCRNLWHGSQISIYLSRVKFAEEIVFLFFLSDFFPDFEQKTFRTFGRKTSRICQNYLLRVQRNNLCLEFFFKFWIVLHFLQKPLAWFSNIYLRVQSENCGRNSFLIFLFRILSDFERKIFQTFGQKTSKSCQNYLLRVQRNNLWLEIIFKKFEALCIFCRNLWHGSQISIYLSRVKFAEEIVFLFFLSDFFPDFEQKTFRTFGRKTSRIFQNYLLRVQRNNLCLEFFFKFWIVLHFLQKPLAWFSNIYLRVQSENCGRNSFLIFLFRIFSDFERKIFQTFGQKTSKSCQNYLLRVQRNNLWLETFFKSFEALCIFCRNLWHGSQISIYVSRVKFAEDIVFLFSFLIFFRILSEKLFGLLADKRQEFVKTTFYVSRGTICALNFF